jgi:pimeloyl-ACP methyl ester carboxylesterase
MMTVFVAAAITISAFAMAPDGASRVAAATVIQPDRDVSWVTSGITIHASYRGPAAGHTGVAAALIIGGTGEVDRDGNSSLLPGVEMDEYEWLADRLSALGIASLRYDKVGTGATGLGPFTSDPAALLTMSYDQLRVQPARDGLRFLARQAGVDPSRLILIGHSEGGAVATQIATHLGDAPALAGLALLEPAYTHILDVIARQLTDQMQAAVQGGAMDAGDATTLTDWMHDGIDEIRAGDAPYPAPGPVPLPEATDFTAVMQSTIASNVYGSDPAQMVLTHSFRTRYGKEFDEIDPPALAPSIRISTLVTCGTKDFNTPCTPGGAVGTGVSAMAAQFAPGVARFVTVPNMVHIFRDVGDDNPIALADQVKYPFSVNLGEAFDAFALQFVPGTPATPRPVTATPRFTG